MFPKRCLRSVTAACRNGTPPPKARAAHNSPVGCCGTSRRAMLGATSHAFWRLLRRSPSPIVPYGPIGGSFFAGVRWPGRSHSPFLKTRRSVVGGVGDAAPYRRVCCLLPVACRLLPRRNGVSWRTVAGAISAQQPGGLLRVVAESYARSDMAWRSRHRRYRADLIPDA